METEDGTGSAHVSGGRAESAPAGAGRSAAIYPGPEGPRQTVRGGCTVTMELPLVLVLVLVVLDAAAETLNSCCPDLLPQKCGWRAVDEFNTYRPRIVGGDDR